MGLVSHVTISSIFLSLHLPHWPAHQQSETPHPSNAWRTSEGNTAYESVSTGMVPFTLSLKNQKCFMSEPFLSENTLLPASLASVPRHWPLPLQRMRMYAPCACSNENRASSEAESVTNVVFHVFSFDR